jgi:hypothetical protein
MSEVKGLSGWNAARIKKQLAGNAAPELLVTDIQGKPVKLSALKGRLCCSASGRHGAVHAAQMARRSISYTGNTAAGIWRLLGSR